MLSSPKGVVIALILVVVGVTSVLGGALGAAFGGGFLGGAVPLIQIPSELIVSFSGYDLVNTVIMFFLAMIVLVVITLLATRKLSEVPGRWQGLMEIFYEFFINLAESAAGGRRGRMFLPVVTAIFLVVLFSNWLGVLPVVGTIGRIETPAEWFTHKLEAKLEESGSAHGHELLEELHHDVKEKGYEDGLAYFIEHGKEDSELRKYVGKTLKEYSDQRFVVFDGGSGPGLLPFGRGEDYKISLRHIVAYDVSDLEAINESEAADIATRFEVGEAPMEVPSDSQFFVDNASSYDGIRGKRAGILVPYLRGSSTDLNMTLALAIAAMISVQFWGIRTLGVGGYWDKFVGNPFKRSPIDLFVGVLEMVGEFIKVISFTFRLFGNMFAGEVLLIAMGFLFPLIGMIPFIGLELFIGFIQAIIFSVLTLMFGAFAIMPHHHPGDDGHHASEGAH